jgi:hypothetical protein
VAQQALVVEVGRRLQLRGQRRVAHREDAFLEQFPGEQAGPFLLAVAQADVSFAGEQRAEAGGAADDEFEIGVQLLIGGDAADQPLAAQGRRRRQAQAFALRRAQQGAGFVEAQQAVADHGQEAAAGRGQRDGAVAALEQRLAEVFFKQADAVADRRGGQVQRFGGGEEAAEAGGGFEGGQGVQRRQVAHGAARR